MAATTVINRFGNALTLLLAELAVLLLARFTITGLGWAPGSAWGMGLVEATTEVVGPFYHLFGTHPLADLGAAVCCAAAAQGLYMAARRPLTRLSLPTIAWGSSLPAALN